jgi:hypothetical protein
MSEEDARYICVVCHGYISHARYRKGYKTCQTCGDIADKIKEYKAGKLNTNTTKEQA